MNMDKHKLKQDLDACFAQCEALLGEGDGGVLTEEQQGQFDAFLARAETIGAQIREEPMELEGDSRTKLSAMREAFPRGSKRKTQPSTPRGPGDFGFSGAPSPPAQLGKQGSPWRDLSGNPIPCFGSEESLAGDDAWRGESRPGSLIRGLITGRMYDASEPHTIGIPSGGGAFLPTNVSRMLIDLTRARMVMNAISTTIPMTDDHLVVVRQDSDPSPAFIGEGAEIPESETTFGRITLRARKCAAICKISRELAEDSPQAEQAIEQALARSMASVLDERFLAGDGVGESPLGILNVSGTESITSVGSPDFDAFLDAIEAVELQNGTPNFAGMHPAAAATLRKLKDDQGAYLEPPQRWQELTKRHSTAFPTSKAVVLDSSLAQILIGLRQGVQVEVSQDPDFESDLLTIKARWRGDIAVCRPSQVCVLSDIA